MTLRRAAGVNMYHLFVCGIFTSHYPQHTLNSCSSCCSSCSSPATLHNGALLCQRGAGGGFWSCLSSFLHSPQESFAFHFRASYTWQSGCSDQRGESRAVARFVSSRSVTQLRRPNGTEANTHPNVATSKES